MVDLSLRDVRLEGPSADNDDVGSKAESELRKVSGGRVTRS